MRNSAYEQFATIHEESGTLFDIRLNEKVRELKAYNPKVKFSDSVPFYAHISYVVNETIPETVAEASEIEGVRFVCAQCPYFEPARTQDGEIDHRHNYGDCPHAEIGRVKKTEPACDRLYQLIKEGDVRLCFND